MSTPARTIDLGELTPGPPSDLDPPWPVLVRLRRWHTPRRTGRLAGLAAVTVLVLLTATAAVAPPRPLFTPQLTLPAVVGVEYDQQHLYVVEAPAPDEARVVAYRLADWTVEWEAPLPNSGITPGMFGWEGVLLTQSYGGIGSETVALDPRTGRKLWDWSGDQGETLAGGRFLVTDLERADLTEPTPPPHQLTALDPATGRPVWTIPVPGGTYTSGFDLDSRYLVTYGGAGGELVSYDLATGERLAGAVFPELDSLDVQVQVVGSLVLLRDPSGSPRDLLAYDAGTLAHLWTLPDPVGLGHLLPMACGDLLCVSSQGQPLRAVDPATGERVWSADWLAVTDDDFVWVSELAGAGAGRDGLLLARGRSGTWLIDAGTGGLALDLGDWQLSPPRQWAAPGPGAAPPEPLLFHPDADRTVVGRLAPDRSGIRPLGAIDTTRPWLCDAGAGFVLCATEPDNERLRELTVWRHGLP